MADHHLVCCINANTTILFLWTNNFLKTSKFKVFRIFKKRVNRTVQSLEFEWQVHFHMAKCVKINLTSELDHLKQNTKKILFTKQATIKTKLVIATHHVVNQYPIQMSKPNPTSNDVPKYNTFHVLHVVPHVVAFIKMLKEEAWVFFHLKNKLTYVRTNERTQANKIYCPFSLMPWHP